MASMDVQMEAAEARKAVRRMCWFSRIATPSQLCHGRIGSFCNLGACHHCCGHVRLKTGVMSCRPLQRRRHRRRPVCASGNGQPLRRLGAAPQRTPHAAPLGCSLQLEGGAENCFQAL